jgi:hypothetical protein
MRIGVLTGLVLFVACGDDATPTRDAGSTADGGGTDSGGRDSAVPDAGGDICTRDQVVVSPEAGGAFAPTAMVWNGSGWAMAWGFDEDGDGPEIYFQRMEPDGTPIGAALRVTNAPRLSLVPSLVWTGTEYGVAWNDQRDAMMGSPDAEIYFARIDAAGNKIGDDLRVTNVPGQSYRPALVWAGSSYGVTWNDDRAGNQEIFFQRIGSDGALAGDPVRITSAEGSSLFSDLAASDSGFGVVWNDDRDGTTRAYFQTLSEAGAPIGMPALVGPNDGGSYGASIEWNGEEFGVSFTQEIGGRPDDTEIYFTRFGGDGTPIGTEVRMRDAAGGADVSVPASDGTGWVVAWRDNRDDPMSGEIYYAPVTESGPGTAVNLTMDSADSTVPAIVWNGTLYGVGWHSVRGMPMPEEKRFLRICP